MTTSINQPTKTWVNPRWASTPEWARPIVQSLEQFLARPTFYNGVELGDGTAPTKDPTTGVTTPPVTQPIDGGSYLPLIGPVGTLDIVDGAITTLKIDLGAVDTAQIAVGAIQTSVIAAGAVTTTQIADGSISTPKLIAGSITTAKIAAGAITATEIAANAITASKILAGEIGTTHLAALSITAAKIAANTITAAQMSTLSLSVSQWVRSSNYVSGSAGWAIDGTGAAEFNNVTVRGTVVAGGGDVTIDSNGIKILGGVASTNEVRWVNGTGVTKAYIHSTTGGQMDIYCVGDLSLQSGGVDLTLAVGGGMYTTGLSTLTLDGNVDLTGNTLTTTSLQMVVLGTTYNVSIGATDSYLPGTASGYRALRVPN